MSVAQGGSQVDGCIVFRDMFDVALKVKWESKTSLQEEGVGEVLTVGFS